MAAIEKIYGSSEQFNELQGWLSESNPELLKHLNPEGNHDAGAQIALFPEEADIWLLDNCPFQWLVDQIKDQYGDDLDELYEYHGRQRIDISE